MPNFRHTACSASTWKIEPIPIPGIGNHREILEALKRFGDFGGPKRGVTFCDAVRTLDNLALLSLLKSDELFLICLNPFRLL